MLQDAHIHLQDAGTEGLRILREAPAARAGRFFCNGSSPSDWEEVRAIAESSEAAVPFYGVHPWYINEAGTGWEEKLREYLTPGRSCVGEIGLDKARGKADFDKQLHIFARQLDVASSLNKPFAVHCVQAWEALLAELARHGAKGLPPFIIHWFSGSPEVAAELVRLGAYISFSPRIMDEGPSRQRDSFARVPVERILLETDYPYMPGAKKGAAPTADGYFNMLRSLYSCAAGLKDIAGEVFENRIWDNGTVFVH